LRIAAYIVRELGALGLAGRARRVEDHRGIGAGALSDLTGGLGCAQQRVEIAGPHEHAFGAGIGGSGAGVLFEPVPGEHQVGS
jgi:hypothetical protein